MQDAGIRVNRSHSREINMHIQNNEIHSHFHRTVDAHMAMCIQNVKIYPCTQKNRKHVQNERMHEKFTRKKHTWVGQQYMLTPALPQYV
jgi:hypothetical protein